LYSYYEGEYIDVQSTGTVSQVISTTQFLITALKEPLNNSNIFGTNVPISTAVSNITGVAGYVTVTNNNTVNTVISGVTQVIPPGTLISAPQAIIPSGTFVVSYNNATGALVTNNALTINAGYQLVFVNFYMLTTSVAAPNVAVNAVLTFSSTTSRADYLSVFNTENPAYPALHAGFDRKENKYVGNLRNFTPASNGEVIWGRSISGIKGFYALGTFSTDTITEPGSEKQLFSVESSYIMNNGY
jgi:hypothetical protein